MDFCGSYIFMAILMVLCIALAIGGLVIARKYLKHLLHESHHSVAGPFLSIVATLYAVVLGFIVVDALNTFQRARLNVEQEANCIHDIFHLAQGLSDPTRSNLRKSCLAYADAMVTYEWPAMEEGRISTDGHQIFTRMWHDVTSYTPKTDAENTFLSSLLDDMKTCGDDRHARYLATKPTYDWSLWFMLIAGAIVVVFFTYLFIAEKFMLQVLMTGLVTFVVVLNLVVVGLFDTPFSGDVKVSPAAFIATSEGLKAEYNEQ